MICRYDNSGLGSLAREFAEHLNPSKVALVANGFFQTFPERYERFDKVVINSNSSFTDEQKKWLTEDVDVLFTMETFYDWGIISQCRKNNVKSVLYTMCEMTPEPLPRFPDLFLCPSALDYQMMPKPKVYLPVPMNTEKLVWRERKTADVFVHTASHGGVNNRKGTHLLLEAMKHVQSNIKLIIYSWIPFKCDDPRVEIRVQNFKNYWQVWREGDVLVYPQDYNGICLPVVEAMSSGLAVITTDIFPFNEYMPKELLIKPKGMYRTQAHLGLQFVEAAKIEPKDIARKIDEIAGKDITKYSHYGKQWVQDNSWEKLLPQYLQVLENLCKK